MWNPAVQAAFLAVAGVAGGTAGSAGAIGSLVTYPALLAVGVPALSANVTNSVAVVASGATATLSSRPELRGQGQRLRRSSTVVVAGSVAGAILLLQTPRDLFGWIVPFLIGGSSASLLRRPRAGAAAPPGRRPSTGFTVALAAVALYNGYFGAASGIMTLALISWRVEPELVRANAMKNALLVLADVVVAVLFTVFGPVRWSAALPLFAGSLLGGYLGPAIARRVPAGGLRTVIGMAGLALAIGLLVQRLG